jgi:hypothetical protein
MPSFGLQLAEQLGTQAASQGLGGLMGMLFQHQQNQNQLGQNNALLQQNVQAQEALGNFNYQKQMDFWNATGPEAKMKQEKRIFSNGIRGK